MFPFTTFQIKSGRDQSAPSINNGTNGRFCGNIRPMISESRSNTVFVRFISDGRGSGAGFSLVYQEVLMACGGHRLLSDHIREGYLTSPDYPQNYKHNLDCTWIIMAPASETIQLEFEDFNIERGAR